MSSDSAREKKITHGILARIAAAFAAIAYGIQNPSGKLPTGTLPSLGPRGPAHFEGSMPGYSGPRLLENARGGTRRQRRGNRKHRSRSNKTRKNGGV